MNKVLVCCTCQVCLRSATQKRIKRRTPMRTCFCCMSSACFLFLFSCWAWKSSTFRLPLSLYLVPSGTLNLNSYTHVQPFYGPVSGTTRLGRYQKRHSPTHTWNVLWESVIIVDFMRREEDNRGKCTDNPAGRHPIRTIDAPPPSSPQFYAGCPSCRNPPNLSWHQICWIAYLEAWLNLFRNVGRLTQSILYTRYLLWLL